jgi:hypothetical protein
MENHIERERKKVRGKMVRIEKEKERDIVI